MSGPATPPLGPSLDFLAWHLIAHAVLAVFEENETAFKADPRHLEPKADTWAWHSARRAELFTRAQAHWCEVARLGPEWFPYSEDFVCRAYMRYRKRNPDDRAAYRIEVNRELTLSGNTPAPPAGTPLAPTSGTTGQ